ncbi:MAG: glycosyltransferase family 2 protein [Clostridia bacterium]|nr:glycosyltransferase family 2 protein [Clostridia bacterium]
MKNTKVIVLFTCYNRKKETMNAIKKISDNNIDVEFLIVDDKSTDGTVEEINKLENIKKEIIISDGNLYYTRGMRLGMQYLLKQNKKYDYILIINDDVDFFDGFLNKMISYSEKKEGVLIGATIDENNKLSYGGIKYKNKYRARLTRVGPEYQGKCDTFNANCVLIPYNYFVKTGPMDKHYTHSIGDYDYGFKLRKNNFELYMFNEYVGICNRNSVTNTWQDTNLRIFKRIKKKEEVKGLPLKENFYYYYTNFNIFVAIKCSIVPYIQILMKK